MPLQSRVQLWRENSERQLSRITLYFVLLGVLALAFGWFFFRYGRYSAFINYIENQYGAHKAWRYIFIVIAIGILLRILLDLSIDNPWAGE